MVWTCTGGGVGKVKRLDATSTAVCFNAAFDSSFDSVNDDSSTSRILETILEIGTILSAELDSISFHNKSKYLIEDTTVKNKRTKKGN